MVAEATEFDVKDWTIKFQKHMVDLATASIELGLITLEERDEEIAELTTERDNLALEVERLEQLLNGKPKRKGGSK